MLRADRCRTTGPGRKPHGEDDPGFPRSRESAATATGTATCGAARKGCPALPTHSGHESFYDQPPCRVSLRPGFRAVFCRSWVRSASLTAFDVLKTSATSGASTMTLDPFSNRAAYFPRTPAVKSYSRRISSFASGVLAELIVSPFP